MCEAKSCFLLDVLSCSHTVLVGLEETLKRCFENWLSNWLSISILTLLNISFNRLPRLLEWGPSHCSCLIPVLPFALQRGERGGCLFRVFELKSAFVPIRYDAA